jgi:hypothetical protein
LRVTMIDLSRSGESCGPRPCRRGDSGVLTSRHSPHRAKCLASAIS